MDANIDFIGREQATGQVANFFLNQSQFDVGRSRPWIGNDRRPYVTVYKGGDPGKPENYVNEPVYTNATLRRDEWKSLDEAVLRVAETRLNGIQDLINRGLTYNLGNAMGTTVLEWHDVSDAFDAVLTMDGVTRGYNDRPVFTHHYLPIPIIHVDYEINTRVLAASRNLGNPLDTTAAERAARKVSEYLENMLFTDTSYAFGGGTIYSYVNYPHRNQVTLSENWDNSSAKSPRDIINEVLSLKQTSIDNLHYGPWVLYIPTAYETVLDDDMEDTGTTSMGITIRERLMKISGILDIKVIDALPANNVLFVQMTSDVVRLVRGMGIQNVQWQAEGNFVNRYKVMTIQVPQIRSDQNGKCGIVHLAA
jgi:hypothetical protein